MNLYIISTFKDCEFALKFENVTSINIVKLWFVLYTIVVFDEYYTNNANSKNCKIHSKTQQPGKIRVLIDFDIRVTQLTKLDFFI